MKFWDTIYFKWITASVVFISISLAFVSLWKGLINGETFGEIIGGAFALQGSRTIATKALDFGYRYLEKTKEQIHHEVGNLDDNALAKRANEVAGSN